MTQLTRTVLLNRRDTSGSLSEFINDALDNSNVEEGSRLSVIEVVRDTFYKTVRTVLVDFEEENSYEKETFYPVSFLKNHALTMQKILNVHVDSVYDIKGCFWRWIDSKDKSSPFDVWFSPSSDPNTIVSYDVPILRKILIK